MEAREDYTHLYEKETSRQIIFNGKIFSVANCKAELYDGREVYREIVLHNGGVGILPIDNDGCIYLVRQYRYAANDITLEIPAGKLEVNENLKDCAVRELSEETGFEAEEILYLGKNYSSPAILSEIIHIYIAKGLSSGKQHLDDDEELNVVKVKLTDAVNMVMNGEIVDFKTQIAILKAYKLFCKE